MASIYKLIFSTRERYESDIKLVFGEKKICGGKMKQTLLILRRWDKLLYIYCFCFAYYSLCKLRKLSLLSCIFTEMMSSLQHLKLQPQQWAHRGLHGGGVGIKPGQDVHKPHQHSHTTALSSGKQRTVQTLPHKPVGLCSRTPGAQVKTHSTHWPMELF